MTPEKERGKWRLVSQNTGKIDCEAMDFEVACKDFEIMGESYLGLGSTSGTPELQTGLWSQESTREYGQPTTANSTNLMTTIMPLIHDLKELRTPRAQGINSPCQSFEIRNVGKSNNLKEAKSPSNGSTGHTRVDCRRMRDRSKDMDSDELDDREIEMIEKLEFDISSQIGVFQLHIQRENTVLKKNQEYLKYLLNTIEMQRKQTLAKLKHLESQYAKLQSEREDTKSDMLHLEIEEQKIENMKKQVDSDREQIIQERDHIALEREHIRYENDKIKSDLNHLSIERASFNDERLQWKAQREAEQADQHKRELSIARREEFIKIREKEIECINSSKNELLNAWKSTLESDRKQYHEEIQAQIQQNNEERILNRRVQQELIEEKSLLDKEKLEFEQLKIQFQREIDLNNNELALRKAELESEHNALQQRLEEKSQSLKKLSISLGEREASARTVEAEYHRKMEDLRENQNDIKEWKLNLNEREIELNNMENEVAESRKCLNTREEAFQEQMSAFWECVEEKGRWMMARVDEFQRVLKAEEEHIAQNRAELEELELKYNLENDSLKLSVEEGRRQILEREELIAIRENTMKKREAILQKGESELKKRESNIIESLSELEQRRMTVNAKGEELAKLEESFRNGEERLIRKEGELESQGKQIAELQSEFERKSHDLDAMERTLKEQSNELKAKAAALARREESHNSKELMLAQDKQKLKECSQVFEQEKESILLEWGVKKGELEDYASLVEKKHSEIQKWKEAMESKYNLPKKNAACQCAFVSTEGELIESFCRTVQPQPSPNSRKNNTSMKQPVRDHSPQGEKRRSLPQSRSEEASGITTEDTNDPRSKKVRVPAARRNSLDIERDVIRQPTSNSISSIICYGKTTKESNSANISIVPISFDRDVILSTPKRRKRRSPSATPSQASNATQTEINRASIPPALELPSPHVVPREIPRHFTSLPVPPPATSRNILELSSSFHTGNRTPSPSYVEELYQSYPPYMGAYGTPECLQHPRVPLADVSNRKQHSPSFSRMAVLSSQFATSIRAKDGTPKHEDGSSVQSEVELTMHAENRPIPLHNRHQSDFPFDKEISNVVAGRTTPRPYAGPKSLPESAEDTVLEMKRSDFVYFPPPRSLLHRKRFLE